MSPPRQHWRLATLFVLLSVADLTFTWHLLHLSGGKIYEANWFADTVLTRHGFVGLVVFKGSIVVLTITLLGVIGAFRPRTAQRLAAFGCGAVGVVVLYSAILFGSLEFPPAAYSRENTGRPRYGLSMDPLDLRRMEFVALLAQARGALAAGCCTLPEAVAFLATADEGKNPDALARRRARLGASSDREYLAAMAARGALQLLGTEPSAEAQQRVKALLTSYEADFGAALLPFVLGQPRVFERPAAGEGAPIPKQPQRTPKPPLPAKA